MGSHRGVEIGEDGPSQMALEDLASLRAVHGSVVLYPANAPCAAYLVREMADTRGIVYLRTTAAPTRCSTRPTRRSRSVGPSGTAPARTTRWP